jgi:phenylpyruvate tautomerase PptA (4-oxalocrotonate tautomerase family)
MRVFHIGASETTIAKRTSASLQTLQASLSKLCEAGLASQDFERFEREVHALFITAEREVLADELQTLDVDAPAVIIGGQRHRRVLRSSETYTSAVGPVTVRRTLYRTGKGKSVVPMELRAGMVEGHWTPLAARQASFLVAQLAPQACEDTLRELGNMCPSKSSLDRLPKRLSERWEAEREAHEFVLRERFSVPEQAVTLGVSLDGVMVPMKDGERAVKRARSRAAGRQTKGPAGYREAGCATLSFYDRDGERLDTVRFARMPEAKKATLKSMLSEEVAAVLEQRPELTVVKIADGAKDNWSYLGSLVPHGEERVDFFHAAEQLKAAFDAAYGENDSKGRSQFGKNRHVLRHDHDGVEKVIRALVYLRNKHPRRKRIGEVLRYFRRHRRRMDYAEAALCALPIGSGVVEAACKTLVTQRMKCSGMRWRHEGGQAILTLRSLVQSHRFEHAWSLLSMTYRTEVTAPHETEETSRKLAA